ncbi:MAG: aquaporin family protein [Oligoflexia bacterium]|nr:aquaporin family protein [Oligoflexia bacterium]
MSNFLAELIGTMIIIIFGGGVVAGALLNKSKAQNAGWIVITFGWGLGVVVAIYAVGKVSGAHLNPAVTLALATIGQFPWSEVPLYILGQMIGGFVGGALVFFHYLPHWRKTEDPSLKLAVFSTAPAIEKKWANLISEMIATFILILGILAIGANQFAQGLNPLIVGFLVIAIGLSLGGTTGYAINPARDLGPRIAHFILPIHGKGSSQWGYAWVPVVGPIIGGVYGALFYNAIFLNKVETIFYLMSLLILLIFVIAYLKESKNECKCKCK